MLLITRNEARERGLVRYFTGHPCKNGHVAERRVKSGHCIGCTDVACAKMRAKFSEADWKAKQKECDDRYRDADPARKLANSKRATDKMIAKNPEYYRDKAKAWRKANRKKFYEIQRRAIAKFRAENPLLAKIREASTRATYRAKSGAVLSPSGLSIVVRRVWDSCGGKCAVCSSSEKLELDHIIAVANGGSNAEENLQFLCAPCNRSKGTKDFELWLKGRTEGMAA